MPDSFLPMHNTTDDSERVIQQIADAIFPGLEKEPKETMSHSGSPDVNSVLIQLSAAVAQARSEFDKDCSLRMILELENEVMRHKELLLKESSQISLYTDGAISTGHPVSYSDYSRSTTTGSVFSFGKLVDSTRSLSDCLSLFSSMPPHMQDALYMSYFESGLSDIDPECIARIYQPVDFDSLCFVMFTSTGISLPQSLLKFNIDDLEAIVASSFPSPLQSTTSPSTVVEGYYGVDDTPRMNLLDALNVHPGDSIDHIVTVRKCHKLGFKSNVHLKQYFSKYGKVDRVVLLPMRIKQLNKGNRPSSMGFVVFESPQVAARVLQLETHTVKGWPIEVRTFVKPADKEEFY